MNVLLNGQGLMTRENLDMFGTDASVWAKSFNPQLLESVVINHQVYNLQKETELLKKEKGSNNHDNPN